MSSSFRRLFRNFSTFLLAFILAAAVWITAVVSTDPNEENPYQPIPLEVVGQDSSLVLMGSIPDQARITINAPKSIWNHLLNNPGLLKAWIDFTGLGAGEHLVKVEVQVNASPLRVSQVEPSEIRVVLEPQATHKFPVELNITGDPPLGYKKEIPYSDPGEVTISGPASAIAKVGQVRAQFNIAGASQSVNASVLVEVLDKNGTAVNNITVLPRSVTITQPISLLGGFKNVAVKVETKGQVANGYRLTNLTVTPPTVTVSSTNPRTVNELPGYIETMPVDLTNLTDDVEINVNLNLPKGVTLVREPSVLVQIGVAAIEGSLTMTLPVEILGLAPGLQAVVSPVSLDVIISGPLPVLDTLSQSSFRIVVDLTGLELGTHQVKPVIDLAPDKVSVQTLLPDTIEVNILPAPTATPTSTPVATSTQTPTATRAPILPTHPRATPTPTRKP